MYTWQKTGTTRIFLVGPNGETQVAKATVEALVESVTCREFVSGVSGLVLRQTEGKSEVGVTRYVIA